MSPAERVRRLAFWRRVQRRLDVLELGRNEFGRLVGMGSGPVSQGFTHLRLPSGEHLLRFPKALKCSGHWLLTGEPPEEPARRTPADYRAGVREACGELIEAARVLRNERGGRR